MRLKVADLMRSRAPKARLIPLSWTKATIETYLEKAKEIDSSLPSMPEISVPGAAGTALARTMSSDSTL
jgi:hypothetical protein